MKEANKNLSSFDNVAKEVFSFLIIKFNYRLIETVEKEFFVKHTYRNRWRRRKITIENQTYPGDYGFSIFIQNIWTKELNLFYNKWLTDEKLLDSLTQAKNTILANSVYLNLIKGRNWKSLKREFSDEKINEA